MELERQFIERTEFSPVRKGYDPDEVDRHLREIAQAVEELKRSRETPSAAAAPSTVAGAAAEQVRAIVEAAETSAARIEEEARAEADRVTGEATRAAEEERETARGEAERMRREAEQATQESRQRAETQAAEHIAKVQDSTAGMRERADAVETDLQRLVDQLRGTIESLVESVRSSAGSLEAELQTIHAELDVVRAPAVEDQTVESAAVGAGAADAPEPVAYEDADAGGQLPVDEDPEHPDAAVAEDELEYADEELETGRAEEVEVEEVEVEEGGVEEDVVAAEEEEAAAVPAAEEEAVPASEGDGAEGARLIALNMALNGTPREETAQYLEENFDLDDQDQILDEVYARVGG